MLTTWRGTLVNDRYSFFAYLKTPIICRSDIAYYRPSADYLQIRQNCSRSDKIQLSAWISAYLNRSFTKAHKKFSPQRGTGKMSTMCQKGERTFHDVSIFVKNISLWQGRGGDKINLLRDHLRTHKRVPGVEAARKKTKREIARKTNKKPTCVSQSETEDETQSGENWTVVLVFLVWVKIAKSGNWIKCKS